MLNNRDKDYVDMQINRADDRLKDLISNIDIHDCKLDKKVTNLMRNINKMGLQEN